MFQPGDLIIYANSGVCKITAVGSPTCTGEDSEKLYYTLQPVYGTETIYIPVDTSVFMRPIISRAEAEELIAEIPLIRSDAYSNHNLNMLKEHYESSMQSHACEDLIHLIKSVYNKNIDATQSGRKLGQVDQRYMKRAEELLYGEFAAALGIERDEVLPYIEQVAEKVELAQVAE